MVGQNKKYTFCCQSMSLAHLGSLYLSNLKFLAELQDKI